MCGVAFPILKNDLPQNQARHCSLGAVKRNTSQPAVSVGTKVFVLESRQTLLMFSSEGGLLHTREFFFPFLPKKEGFHLKSWTVQKIFRVDVGYFFL